MSYDLVFWRQRKPLQCPPVEVYRKLNTKANLEGHLDLPVLAELPVEQILARLKTAYRDFARSAHGGSFQTPDGHCDVSWSAKHFDFAIEGDLGDSLNPLVEIMGEFGCPPFDPQKNQRYDADHGLAVGTLPRFKSLTREEKLARQKSYDAVLSHEDGHSSAERTTRILKALLGACVALLVVFVILYVVRK